MKSFVKAAALSVVLTCLMSSSQAQAAEMKVHHFLGEFKVDVGVLKYRGGWWLNVYDDNKVKIQGWHKGYIAGHKVIDQKGGKVFAETRLGDSVEGEYKIAGVTIYTQVTLIKAGDGFAEFRVTMDVGFKGAKGRLLNEKVKVRW